MTATTGSTRDGILTSSGDPNKPLLKLKIADIADGTSNTLMVGERPPSIDLNLGWWFAGAGYDGSSGIGTGGTMDVLLGSRDIPAFAWGGFYDGNNNTVSCSAKPPAQFTGLKPGDINDACHQLHFWSFHSGGANFLLGDGSCRFLNYSIDPGAGPNDLFVALCTRSGGEAVTLP